MVVCIYLLVLFLSILLETKKPRSVYSWAWQDLRGTETYDCMVPEPAIRQARGIIIKDVSQRVKRSTRFGTGTSTNWFISIIIIVVNFGCQ